MKTLLDWAGRKIRYLLRLPEIQLVRNVRETNNVCRLMETEENESKAREDTPVENNNVIRNMRQGIEFEWLINIGEKGLRKQDEITAVGSQQVL